MLKFIFNFDTNLKFTGLVSTLCVASSIFTQYVFDKTPCLLCLLSRICFIVVAIACFLAIKQKHLNWIQSLPLSTLFVLFCICFYHLGVENSWWMAPETCRTILPTLDSPEPVTLLNGRPPCDSAGFHIFGISITLFSFAVSGCLTWLHSIAFILRKFV